MSVRKDVINLDINVNGNKSLNELNDLRKKAADVKFEMDGLKRGTAEYIAKRKELTDITSEMAKLKQQIGLTSLSQKELTAELKKLTAMRSSVAPFSAEYDKLSDSIKKVENRLYDVRNGVQGFSSFLSKIKDEVKQFGVMAAGYLGFQFLTSQFQNIISGLGKVSDQFADIQKVSGLSAEEVKALNKELSSIDTRTSTSQLREMAVAAGKLGKDSSEDILGFVRAADQISVALGDDLSGSTEDIMKKLGKITQVFKTEEMYGTEQGLLKIGSAVNELSAASNASADYMVDFSKRMAGVAPLAGISIQQILGLGATLDQFGQTAEVSSTALSKLFIKMASDSTTFAKYAGMEVTAFKDLLEKDFMAAFVKVLQGVKNNSNGINELAGSLGDLGLDGGRVIGVLGTLANNTDTLTDQILMANDAFEEGVSITNEFAIKNNNLAATLDKISKEINKLMTSRTLNNILETAANATLKLIQTLKDLPGLFERNKFTIIALATAVALLTKNVLLNATAWIFEKGAMIAEGVLAARRAGTLLLAAAYNVLTGNITRASAAWMLFSRTFTAGPIGLVIVALIGLGVALDRAFKKTSALQEAQTRANQSTVETTTKIELLTKVARDNTVSLENRQKALKELIAIAPEYLGNLNLENIQTKEGTKLIEDYVKGLNERAQAQARYNLMVEKMQQREEARAKIRGRLSGSGLSFTDENIDAMAKGRPSWIPDVYSDLNKLNTDIAELQGNIEASAKKNVATVINTGEQTVNATVKAGENTIAARKEFLEKEIKTLEESYGQLGLHEKEAIRKNFNQRRKYQDELDRLNGRETKSDRKFNSDHARLEKEAADFYKRLEKLKEQAQIKGEDPNQREIEAVEAKYRELTERAKLLYIDQLRSKERYSQAEVLIEEAKQQELDNIFKKHYQRRMQEAGDAEYTKAIEGWREYIDQQKILTAKAYAEGKITQQQYSAEIEALDVQEKQNLVLIAQDYAGNVKKAASDLKKFRKDAEKEATDAAIKEIERRKEYEDREKLAGAQGAVYRARPGSDARLQAQKTLLETQFELETQYLDKRSEQYKAAEAKLQEELLEMQRQHNVQRIDNIMQFVGYFQEAMNSVEQSMRNREQRMLNTEKRANDEKKTLYKKQLDSKLISQSQYNKKVEQAEAELNRKTKDVQREQARREKALNIFNAIINTATAVTKALASAAPPYNFALAAAVGIAGALQIGAISSAPLPELGTGGWLKTGPKHKDAKRGTQVLIERDEAVMSAAAMTDDKEYQVTGTPAQITSALNSRNGGVSWAGGAVVRMADRNRRAGAISSQMPQIMAQGGMVRSMDTTHPAAVPTSDNEALQAVLQEVQGMRNDMKNWNDRLHAVVSIKEYREKEKLYDDAQRASGIN